MQLAENLSACRTPRHAAAGWGAFQRRSPVGAAAYGMPLKTRTEVSLPAAPDTRPLRVFTGCVRAYSGAANTIQAKSEINFFLFTNAILLQRPRKEYPRPARPRCLKSSGAESARFRRYRRHRRGP